MKQLHSNKIPVHRNKILIALIIKRTEMHLVKSIFYDPYKNYLTVFGLYNSYQQNTMNLKAQIYILGGGGI